MNRSFQNSTPFLFRATLGILLLALLFLLCLLLELSHFFLIYAVLPLIAISLSKPFYPLYFLAFILPFFGNNPGGGHFLFFVDMVMVIILLRWLTPLLFAKKISLRDSRFGIWLWLFFIISLVSLFPLRYEIRNEIRIVSGVKWFAKNVFNSYAVNYFWSLRAAVNLFLSILFFYYVINNVKEKKQLKNLAICALSGLFLSIAFGVLDFHNIIELTFFRPVNPDIQRFGYKRLMSLFWHSGWFAQYLVLLSPFYLSLLLFGKLKPKPGMIILSLTIPYALVLTYQRAGWIAFIASFVFLVIMIARYRFLSMRSLKRILIAMSILALLLTSIVFIASDASVRTTLSKRAKNVLQFKDRSSIWRQALFLYSKKPFIGVGLGNYYNYHRSTFPPGHPYFDDDKVTAHNTYLHLLVERGPFALLFFVCLLGAAFRFLLKSLDKDGEDPDQRMIAVALLSSLAGFSVYALAQYMFYIRVIDILFWLILGLSEVISRPRAGEMMEKKALPYKKALGGFSLLFIILLSFQPTARDMFFWNKCGHIDDKFIGSWFDPWDELISSCDKEVVETRFFLFHPDVATNPVYVDLMVNDRPLATFIARDKNPHSIAALVPRHFKRPLRIGLRVDRLVRMKDLFSEFEHDRREFHCVGERNVLCRDLGLDGVGFHSWEKPGDTRFRWTCAIKALCDIDVTSPVLSLILIARNPDLSQKPLSVSIAFFDDKGEKIFNRDSRIHEQDSAIERFDLSPYVGKTLRMEIETDRLFCPLDFNMDDSRVLGIYVSEPVWE